MLNDRAREILSYIRGFQEEHGLPPTIREIGKAFGISSTNGVRYYLTLLEKAGYLRRRDRVSRGSSLLASVRRPGIPLVGRVAAGQPILAEERIEDTVQVDSFFLGTSKKVYGLRVQGDSMIGDGILPGDYIFVKKQLDARDGEIVVAMIDDEATVKRVYFEGDRVRFQPSNPRMAPIYVRESDFRSTMILGVVVGVYRKLA